MAKATRRDTGASDATPAAAPGTPPSPETGEMDVVIMEKLVVTDKRVRDLDIQIAEINALIANKARDTQPTKLDTVLNNPKISFLGGFSSAARVYGAQATIQRLEFQKQVLLIMRATLVREEYERYETLLAKTQEDLRPAGPEPLGAPRDGAPSATSRAFAPPPQTAVVIPPAQNPPAQNPPAQKQ